ncbi:MAG: hypothetical protein H6718_24765 [Polyangiaceae bacterium]|nr:hypothetical protein [Polyangiaceae bacterium]MCB9605204.1 hypothetical protein [Polyangiaceae bacterium]
MSSLPHRPEPVGYAGPERRVLRSSDPLTALERLLDEARRQSRGAALLVADSSGLLVAASGYWSHCEELAAVAAANPANDSGERQVRRVRVAGLEVVLCAEGGDTDAALARAQSGTIRILGNRRRSA